MTLHEFIKIVRQRWIVIVVCTLVAAAVMWIITPANTDTTRKVGSYTATATLLVGSSSMPMGRIALYVTTGEIPQRAAETLGYAGDPALLASGLTVTPDPAAVSLQISATASDGTRAADVANAFAHATVDFFNEQTPASGNVADVTILQEATPIPSDPGGGFVVPPSRTVRTAIGAALGLLFGLALALLLDRLDSRLRTRGEVHEVLGMPVVAEVPRLGRSQRGEGKIEVVRQPLGVYADGYRAARSAITHLPSRHLRNGSVGSELVQQSAALPAAGTDRAAGAKVVLVTSAHAGEGKSTSVANLAASFAETGRQVLVVDADLRSPDMHRHFDVPQAAGVSDYLTEARPPAIEAIMRPTNVAGVRVITAGTRLDYPASLASRLKPLLEDARHQADAVIIDTAPLLATSDVFDILPLADTILLVVRSGRLTESAGRRVAEILGRFQVPVIGAILIGAPLRRADGYYQTKYGYGYGKSKREVLSQVAPEASTPRRSRPTPEASGPRRSTGAGAERSGRREA